MCEARTKFLRGSTAVVLMLTTNAFAEEKGAQQIRQAVGKTGKVVGSISLWSDVRNLLDFRDARLKGAGTPEQANKAAKSIDTLGSRASEAAAAAASGRIGGVVTAVQASALMPIAVSVGRAAGMQGQVLNEFIAATETGAVDSAKIQQLGKTFDANTATLSQWKPDYGSTWNTFGRWVQSIGVSTQNASTAFLESSIKSFQSYFDEKKASTSDEFEPEEKPSTVAPASDQWKMVSIEGFPGGSLLGAEDLNVCESYPGFNSDNWAEVLLDWHFVNTQPGEHCTITTRDEGDPSHKRYAAICTYSWMNDRVYQVLSVTREAKNIIKEVRDMSSSSASEPRSGKIITIYERCEN